MIRTNAEYENDLQRLEPDRRVVAAQRTKLQALGFTATQVAHVLEPALAAQERLRAEVADYETMQRGDIPPIRNLMEIGRVLIGLRIARGMTQRELAERLDVAESQVS